jgi:hypothetical protein
MNKSKAERPTDDELYDLKIYLPCIEEDWSIAAGTIRKLYRLLDLHFKCPHCGKDCTLDEGCPPPEEDEE